MITLSGALIYAGLFLIHLVADFFMPSREMGQKKSSELKWLLHHLMIQFFMFTIGIWLMGLFIADIRTLKMLLLFPILNTIIHGIIDWNIWRFYKLGVYKRLKDETKQFHLSDEDKEKWIAESGKNWQYWLDSWFYHTIGIDQFLHIITIIFLAALCL